ncbi:chemotaxis protein CheW [uncultured Thiodictyon sp.]|uniref:chemotaxis protein CheW n=1 Tax=uncultured Thiodictyon sp. TaxID=1846217 RepID=UPI0025D37D19|nr:chemotaxis protein CheW [uncultured Thiodictyon sp.]
MEPQAAAGVVLFDLIAGVDARLRALPTRLPRQAPPVERWVGILFRVGARRLLASLEQITEVLTVPDELTPLPGTASWVLGVANNRGTLLPIFDLAALTAGGAPTRRDADRVLVVRQEGLPCGLVASEVIGIRRFAVTERVAESPAELGVLWPFAEAAFPLADTLVPVIALERLLGAPLMSLGSA